MSKRVRYVVRKGPSGPRVYGPTRFHLNRVQKKDVAKLINKNIETKYYDYTLTGQTITSTAACSGLPFDISVGDTSSTRDGAKYKLFRLNIRYELFVGDVYNTVRIIIFQWKGLSTATPLPAAASILNAGPTGSIDVNSLYNYDNQPQYVIIYDRTHVLTGNATAAQYGYTTTSVQSVKKRFSLRKCRRVVDLNSSNQGTNRLFFLYISDSGAASHPTMEWASRLEYKDI